MRSASPQARQSQQYHSQGQQQKHGQQKGLVKQVDDQGVLAQCFKPPYRRRLCHSGSNLGWCAVLVSQDANKRPQQEQAEESA